jgi:hypothetical protein
MSVDAMKQALQALVHTDTNPLSSSEQYIKEMQAMEALEDAIKDAEEREWVWVTDRSWMHKQSEKNDFNPDWDQMAILVEENQRLAKQLSEIKDWEAVAADQAMTIAMMKQREWVGLTNDEITEIDRGLDARSYSMFAYTRAIEAKLKEKNHVS